MRIDPSAPNSATVASKGEQWNSGNPPAAARIRSTRAAGATSSAFTGIRSGAGGRLSAPPRWRGIAGYSLAGLFAVFALGGTDLFLRAGSISGSLWFPGIREYLFSHPPKRRPDRLYVSLGDRESKTRNPLLSQVEQNTAELARFYREQGIETVFQLNPGGHADHPAERTAAGLCWLLQQ